jgi:hypothetical protein
MGMHLRGKRTAQNLAFSSGITESKTVSLFPPQQRILDNDSRLYAINMAPTLPWCKKRNYSAFSFFTCKKGFSYRLLHETIRSSLYYTTQIQRERVLCWITFSVKCHIKHVSYICRSNAWFFLPDLCDRQLLDFRGLKISIINVSIQNANSVYVSVLDYQHLNQELTLVH